MKLKRGDRLGDWIIDFPLGAGGMGSVYRVHSVLSAEVFAAVKVLDPSNVGDIQARFVQEMKTLAGLSHPAIVRVLGGGRDEDRGLLYMAMELVDGEDLDARLRRGPLTGDEIPRIFGPVADALAYAHQHGVAHRDIKPGNIMLRKDGTPVIVDFGIAVVAGQTRHTREGMVPGTMVYLPPEAFQGDLPDPQGTDAYALGVVVWESLTGKMAFEAEPSSSEGQQLAQVMGQKLRMDALDPGPDVPAGVRDAVLRTTDPEPEHRLVDLARVRDLLVGDAVPDGRPRRRRRKRGGRRWLTGLLVAATLLIVGSLTVVTLGALTVAGLLWANQRPLVNTRAPVPLQESTQAAAAALSAGDLDTARLHAGHAVDDHPDDPHANLIYGQVLLAEEQGLLARPYLCAAAADLGDAVPGIRDGALSCERGPGAAVPLTSPLAVATIDLSAALARTKALADARQEGVAALEDMDDEGGAADDIAAPAPAPPKVARAEQEPIAEPMREPEPMPEPVMAPGAPSSSDSSMEDEAAYDEVMEEAPAAAREEVEPSASSAPPPPPAPAPPPLAKRSSGGSGKVQDLGGSSANSGTVVVASVKSTAGDSSVRASMKVMLSARSRMQACYATSLADDPYLAGSLVLTVEVAADGSVKSVRAARHRLGSAGSCIEGVVKGLTFPAGAATLTISLDLKP